MSSLRRIASDPFRPTPVNVCRQNKYTCHPERSSATQKYTATYCTKSRNAVEVLRSVASRNGAKPRSDTKGGATKGSINDFRWLAVGWLLFLCARKSKYPQEKPATPQTRSHRQAAPPLALRLSSVLLRFAWLHFAKLRLRSATGCITQFFYFIVRNSAQDDTIECCLAERIACDPYQ